MYLKPGAVARCPDRLPDSSRARRLPGNRWSRAPCGPNGPAGSPIEPGTGSSCPKRETGRSCSTWTSSTRRTRRGMRRTRRSGEHRNAVAAINPYAGELKDQVLALHANDPW